MAIMCPDAQVNPFASCVLRVRTNLCSVTLPRAVQEQSSGALAGASYPASHGCSRAEPPPQGARQKKHKKMSQLKEILEKERERGTLEQCAAIHLFREGSFYRAYEWSAWLCVRYFTELKVTHRLLKGGNDIVFVGFPLTSLDRYTPQGATVLPSGDKSVELALPAEAFAPCTDVESLW